jgi:hypothetical protein
VTEQSVGRVILLTGAGGVTVNVLIPDGTDLFHLSTRG